MGPIPDMSRMRDRTSGSISWSMPHRKNRKKKHPGLYAQPSQIFPTIHKDENEEIYSGGWMINEIVAYMLTLPVDKQGA